MAHVAHTEQPSLQASSDRRSSLRAATSDLHRQLDDLVAVLDLTRPEHYGRFLQASASALIGVETLLDKAGVVRLLPDWAQRRRTDAVLHDLESMHLTAQPYELRRALPSDAEMWGMLYVLEGSRMGARLLLKRVLSSANMHLQSATAYLAANDATLWRTFVDQLEKAPAAADQSATNAAAVYTFAIFQRTFVNATREIA
jgi:heme oxygenase